MALGLNGLSQLNLLCFKWAMCATASMLAKQKKYYNISKHTAVLSHGTGGWTVFHMHVHNQHLIKAHQMNN